MRDQTVVLNRPKLWSRIVVAALVAVLCLATIPSHAVRRITYVHTDALGSPVAASDETGNVYVWKETYAPYGSRLQNQPNANPNTRWFTGHEQDKETGLIYAGARYYDPTLGRFLSPDPKGYAETSWHSFNRYAYGANNPYKYVDPDGREFIFIFSEPPVSLEPVLEPVGTGLVRPSATPIAEPAAQPRLPTDPAYARPSGFRQGVRDKVWENAREPSTKQIRDPSTGRFMSKDKPWDMGHKPRQEFSKHQESAAKRGIDRDKFIEEHNDPTRYRPELPSSNRSHRGEDVTPNYIGP